MVIEATYFLQASPLAATQYLTVQCYDVSEKRRVLQSRSTLRRVRVRRDSGGKINIFDDICHFVSQIQ